MRWTGLFIIAMLCALPACDRADDGDPHVVSGATPKEDVVGWGADTPENPPPPTAPAFDDDDGIRAWGEAALAACGPISSAPPASWEMVLIGDTGCTVHRPPAWTFEVEGASVWLYASAEEEAGVMLLGGVLEGTAWTATTILDGIVDTLREQYPDITIIDAGEGPDPYGLGIVVRIASLKFHDGDVPMVGMLRVIHSPCSDLLGTCPLTAAGTWAPLATLPDFACTLAQIDATVTCPKPGGENCDEGACDGDCKGEGSAYGYCSNDTCVCAG
jgi:hypothetical protein